MPRSKSFTEIDEFDLLEAGEQLPPNGSIAGLIERIGARANREAGARIPFLPWNLNIPLSDGSKIDFETFPYQREWYSDEVVYAKLVAWMKGTQVGASEYAVRWALFFPDTRGDRVLYLFPAARQLKDFSDERIRPLVRTEYLKSRISSDSIDNKQLKQVGVGWFYARGSKNATDLDSIPADELVFDEYDDIEVKNIPRAEKRLSGPRSRGLVRRLGVPRYTDLGIHAQYEASDKRRWFVACRVCQRELPLGFFRDQEDPVHHVDVEREEIVCENCESRIERSWVAEGRWVATHPDRPMIGYHVHRLVVPTVDIQSIIAESRKTKWWEVQEFWNSTLGLPHDPEEGRLSRQAIAAAVSAGGHYMMGPWDASPPSAGLRTMGIDVATVRDLNVIISEHLDEQTRRVLWVGQVHDFDQLAAMMDIWKINMACIDQAPDGRLSRGFAARFPGRVFIVSWGDTAKELISWDEEQSTVHVRRTETIGGTIDLIRKQLIFPPENTPEDYVPHMRSAVLKMEEDEKGKVVVFYEKKGDDDYLQASCYDVVATEVWWLVRLKGDAEREVLQPLDSMLEFRRSRVGELGEEPYDPGGSGFGDDGYVPGGGEYE